ncbi:hypothetical protein [Psychrobacter sp. BI730]|uniref:hypothetical protein n=1 Tax=Psychrobacter sp. BI730 TaxID=2705463 RepID=UPI0015CB7471|nr:hypothetical protein [Psychrobacter sp. BI730]NYR10871.1 hypothetical protein [Psychrobacter sp. BI730]
MLNTVLDWINYTIDNTCEFLSKEQWSQSSIISSQEKREIEKIVKFTNSKLFGLYLLKAKSRRSDSSSALNHTDEVQIDLNVCYSVMLSISKNILIGHNQGVIFVIFQEVTSCDWIYFPKFNIYFSEAYATNKNVRDNIRLLSKFISRSIASRDTMEVSWRSSPSINGILVGNNRPYHYFYDTLIMAELLARENILYQYKTIEISGSRFLDLSSLFNIKNCDSIYADFLAINELTDREGLVFFKVGMSYHRFKKDRDVKLLVESVDKRVNAYCNDLFYSSSLHKTIIEKKRNGYYVLWLGISTEKRSLKNQVSIFTKLICHLSSFHKLCVVVDGLTASITDNNEAVPVENKYSVNDKIAFMDLKKACPMAFFISLLNSKASDKVGVAHLVDFHVCSGGTGSIWTSRLARANGVLHVSQAMYTSAKNSHIHHNSIFFPRELIEDFAEEGQGKSIFNVSYTINAVDFLSFFKKNYRVISSK